MLCTVFVSSKYTVYTYTVENPDEDNPPALYHYIYIYMKLYAKRSKRASLIGWKQPGDISEWSSKAYQNGVEGNGNTVKVKLGCKVGPTIVPVMTA